MGISGFPDAWISGYVFRTSEQSSNRAIEQSRNRAIEQSRNRAIEQSRNRAIDHISITVRGCDAVLRMGYGLLDKRMDKVGTTGGESELVRQTITRQTGSFSLADIRSQCPSVSLQTIKKVLRQFKEAGRIRLSGRGRGARWHLEG
jgi:hypothetical protein